MLWVPGWGGRPQAKRTRCQKSLTLNICQLQTASSNAQKSNTKFAIIQNWRWRKKSLVSALLFRIFFVGLLLFFCWPSWSGSQDYEHGPSAVRPAVCGCRFASFTFSTDAAAFQFVNAACRMPHSSCLWPQPVSDSSARHDKVSVCLHGKKGKFTQFDIDLFLWPEMITAQVSSACVRAQHGACLAWRVVFVFWAPLVAFNHLLDQNFYCRW